MYYQGVLHTVWLSLKRLELPISFLEGKFAYITNEKLVKVHWKPNSVVPLMRGLEGSRQFESPRNNLCRLCGKADVSGNAKDPHRGDLELLSSPRMAPLQGAQADTVGMIEAKTTDEFCTQAPLAPQLAVVRNNFDFSFMYIDCMGFFSFILPIHTLYKPLFS